MIVLWSSLTLLFGIICLILTLVRLRAIRREERQAAGTAHRSKAVESRRYKRGKNGNRPKPPLGMWLMFLLIPCLCAGMWAKTAFAAPGGNDERYTYTVTIYAGNQGSFLNAGGVYAGGGEVSYISGKEIRITGLSYGDRVNINPQSGMVGLEEDSKYYIRGIRESGRDNSTVGNSSFLVDCDRDYVIAYGIRGNMVAYQVNYQDGEGNTPGSKPDLLRRSRRPPGDRVPVY